MRRALLFLIINLMLLNLIPAQEAAPYDGVSKAGISDSSITMPINNSGTKYVYLVDADTKGNIGKSLIVVKSYLYAVF